MDLIENQNVELLARFPPLLRENFKTLCLGRLGLSPFCVSQIIHKEQYTENNESYTFIYSLKIYYASRVLTWDLIFEPEDMRFAPDLRFNDASFHMGTKLDCVTRCVPSLATWDVDNPKSLSLVLNEFLTLYKQQYVEKLSYEEPFASISADFELLTDDFSEDELEVFIEGTIVYFLLGIKVDLSALPEYSQPPKMENWHHPGYDDISLFKISFTELDGSSVITDLRVPPRLEQALGTRTVPMEEFHAEDLELLDYVTLVKIKLIEVIERTGHRYNSKKRYVVTLSATYPEHIVEYDSETFSSADLLLEVDGYFCHVRIELGNEFPDVKPNVNLLSLHCVGAGLCTEPFTAFFYDATWTTEQMIEELFTHLPEAITSFKNHRHQ